jgi:Tfp pilus assembly protein FimV
VRTPLVMTIVIAGLLLAAAPAGAAVSVTVQPGDTLWSIAEQQYPNANVAEVVDALVTLNGGASLGIGQQVRLP